MTLRESQRWLRQPPNPGKIKRCDDVHPVGQPGDRVLCRPGAGHGMPRTPHLFRHPKTKRPGMNRAFSNWLGD